MAFLSLIILADRISAQTTIRVAGSIYDAADGHPINGASIRIAGSEFGAVSDQFGQFQMESIPPGRYRLEISAFGYRAQTTNEIEVVADITRRLTIRLDRLYHDMGRIEVMGRAEKKTVNGPEVIDRDEIVKSNARTLADVLDRMEGVFIQDSGPTGGRKEISIRGSAAKHVLVLMDGRRLNSSGSGEADLNTIPLEMVEKVEVYKGGESARFGADALGGVINIITRADHGQNRPELKAHTYRGKWDTDLYDLTVIDPVKFRGMSTKFTYGARSSAGNFGYNYTGAVYPRHSVERVYSGTRANADFESRNYFLSGVFQPHPSTRVNFSGQVYRSDQGLPGIASQPDTSGRKADARTLVGLGLEHEFSPQQVLEMNLGFSRLRQEFENKSGPSPYHSRFVNDIADMETSGRWGIWIGNEITAGAALQRDILYHNEVLHPERSMGRTVRDNVGVFASDRQFVDLRSIPFWDVATVDASMRWDHTETRRDGLSDAAVITVRRPGHWSRKMGVSLTHGDRLRLIIRGSYGSSYRLPEINALFWKGDVRSQGNPDLKPERSRHSDAGLEVTREGAIKVSAGITYFRSRVEDIIVWRPSSPLGIWTPENLEAALITGHEDFVRIGLRDDLAYFTYSSTITSAVNKSPGSSSYDKILTFRPHYVTSLECGVRWWIIRGSYQVRMVDIRYLLDANTRWYGAYRVDNADLGIETQLSHFNIGIGYQVRNLGGENYELMAQYPMPGREWGINLDVTWRPE